jgi:hypothetical protein
LTVRSAGVRAVTDGGAVSWVNDVVDDESFVW